MEIRRCTNCMEEITNDICPYCGYRESSEEQVSYCLKRNSILHGRYLIGNVLGQGGFGITYIGFDMMLNIKVAVKEYYPMGFVSRDCSQTSRIVWSMTQGAQEYSGCDEFLKEARRMAQIDVLPGIVRVRDTFMDNNTAYIVMDYVEGVTLKSYLAKNGTMGFKECVDMLAPLMESLSEVHRRGLIHRDISPDNIMIGKDGKFYLLDLGAAKELNLGSNSNSKRVAKEGFSPVEQYFENGSIGTWTDVYALCATIYYCISGKLVPVATERISSAKDPLSFDVAMKEPLSTNMKNTLMQGLAIKSDDRIQTVDELKKRLTETQVPASAQKKGAAAKIAVGCAAAVATVIIAAAVVTGLVKDSADDEKETQASFVSETTQDECAVENSSITQSTTQTETAAEADVCFDYTQNVLMPEVIVGKEDENKCVLGKEGISRSSIESVNFLDTLKEMPDDAWDVSEDKNGNVMAWTMPGDNSGKYHLFIAGNGGVMAESCNAQFAYYDNLESILFNECFHTENVSDMYAMFYQCKKLKNLEVEQLDTTNVENMGFMFTGCEALERVKLENFCTDKVNNMEYMFSSCYSLKEINLSSFKTDNVTNMKAMFNSCSSLESIDISSFNTVRVTNMNGLFYCCSGLKSLKMGNINTGHVTDMGCMFADCSALNGKLTLRFNTSSVTTMYAMFSGCSGLTQIDISSLVTSRVNDMRFMFNDCNSLRELDLSTFDTGNVTTMKAMFQSCSSLSSLNISGFDTSHVTDMAYMFFNCSSLKQLDLSSFNMGQVTDRENMMSGAGITEEEAGLK